MSVTLGFIEARECVGCGNTFEPRSNKHKRCSPSCSRERDSKSKNGARKVERDAHEVNFIAVDGEGVSRYKYSTEFDEETGEEQDVRSDTKEIQDYVLLSVGDQSLHKNGKMLNHHDIFTFLWEQYEANPEAAFVGFFLGYDFTMWLKSLDSERAWELLHKDGIAARQPRADSTRRFPFPVRDGGKVWVDDGLAYTTRRWEFDILGMKRFKLRPYVRPENIPTRIVQHKDGTMEVMRESRPWMYICDVGPFFQTSLLKVIHPVNGKGERLPDDHPNRVVTDEEYDRLAAGKEIRSNAQFDEEMVEYNLLENDVLARLMRQLNAGFVADDIRLTKQQWMGPGQAAQAWMRNIGVPTGEEVRAVTPQWALDAARFSYYGGWFEIFNHGPVPGTSYEYDINSAYPAVIATLPCLLHGVWTHGTGKPPRFNTSHYRLVYGTFNGDDDWVGPLPYRESTGSILRPHKVKGWYWYHEVLASKKAGLLNKMDIEEWADYSPCSCAPPMASVRELYNGRLLVGKDTPQGKAKKLVYNSAYGKCAQSVGSPRFANAIYASLITTGCRVSILNAIATHPTKSETLLMVATDGIYFKDPHPNLDIDSERLGAWGYKAMENLSLFMPGLYWNDTARAQIKAGKSPSLKSRGVNPKHLGTIIEIVDRQWKKFDFDNPPPRVSITIDWALIGAKEAVHRNDWTLCGKNLFDITRWVDGKPDAKRDPDLVYKLGGLRSYPYWEGSQLETTYYQPRFGDELDMDDMSGSLVTPDGVIGDLQAQAFGLKG